MRHFPNNPRILLCNDDGVNASGLKVLERLARQLSKDVWIVAPETEQSGASHSLSLRRPLRIRKISAKKYAVDGTPTDCILIALRHLLKGKRPHLVLSGVNYGGNLAEDVTYSGTLAAAMEATLLGIPAIAISLMVNDPHPPKWGTPEHFGVNIISRLMACGWPKNVLINVNFPDLDVRSITGVNVTVQGQRVIDEGLTEAIDPRGRKYYWIGTSGFEKFSEPGSDIAAIGEGAISITPLYMNLTHMESVRTLARHLEKEVK